MDRNVVQAHFNPEVGFLRRTDFQRNFVQARFSPRPANSRFMRKMTYQGDFDYITDNGNTLQSRELQGLFKIDFHNGDAVSVQASRFYEFLDEPFMIATGIRIPVGGYGFGSALVSYTAGAQHKVSGTASLEVGTFYDGTKQSATYRGRIDLTPQLGVEPTISVNRIDLPQGRFTTSIYGGRTIFTMTPRMYFAALIQYSSSNTTLSTNLRFRWEYQPGSELFVVYTEGRSTLPPSGVEALQTRGVVVKINRLFRF
jgi:hypothetical protein